MSMEIGMKERDEVKEEEAPGGTEGGRRPTEAEPGAAPVKRWTAARKQEVVLRLLRGETLDAVSRDVGVPMYRLADWRDRSLMGITAALHEGPGDGREAALEQARRKIGDLLMEIELLKKSPKKASGRRRWKP
ncbi:MAG: IS3 family transposase [Conexivisphaera sp.]